MSTHIIIYIYGPHLLPHSWRHPRVVVAAANPILFELRTDLFRFFPAQGLWKGKGCEEKHSHKAAHYPVGTPPAMHTTAVSQTPTQQQGWGNY